MFKIVSRQFVLLFVFLFVLGAGMGAGVLVERNAQVAHAQTGSSTGTGPDWNLMTEAWNTIERVYVDKSAEETKSLTYGAIGGLVAALGDTGHSTFLTPEMVKSENDYTQGSFEGIGAQVQSKNGQAVIVAPFDDSPAQKAGLRPGDAIVKVDGTAVTGLPLEQVISKILGPAGTPVTLTILDPQDRADA